jgi:hypothetical protein
MINIKGISVFNNKYSFNYILNRFYILRHILFSSLFILYFIYTYLNLNIDFKGIYKIFELIFSREIMFMDYINNKFGLDIYYIDKTNNTNYASNQNNDPTQNNQHAVNNDSSNNNNNSSASNENGEDNAPSPVSIDNLPSPINIVVSDEEDSACDDDLRDIESDETTDYESAHDSDSDTNNNPEYSKKARRLEEERMIKNSHKGELRDNLDGYHEAVADINNNVKKNATIITEVVETRVPKTTLKRGREDSTEMEEEKVETRVTKKARFHDHKSKQEYLNDLKIAEEKKTGIKRTQ